MSQESSAKKVGSNQPLTNQGIGRTPVFHSSWGSLHGELQRRVWVQSLPLSNGRTLAGVNKSTHEYAKTGWCKVDNPTLPEDCKLKYPPSSWDFNEGKQCWRCPDWKVRTRVASHSEKVQKKIKGNELPNLCDKDRLRDMLNDINDANPGMQLNENVASFDKKIRVV